MFKSERVELYAKNPVLAHFFSLSLQKNFPKSIKRTCLKDNISSQAKPSFLLSKTLCPLLAPFPRPRATATYGQGNRFGLYGFILICKNSCFWWPRQMPFPKLCLHYWALWVHSLGSCPIIQLCKIADFPNALSGTRIEVSVIDCKDCG